MKYVKKLPHTDLSLKEKLEKDGWTKIKEPGNLPLAILFAYPLIIVLCGITLLFGYFLNPEIFCVFTENTLSMNIKFDMNMAVLLVAIFAYGLLHEFVHGALIPNVLKSDRTYWGFNGLFGFVYTHEPIKKGRFIIVSCMPFLLLSMLALPVASLFGFLNGYTFLLFLINAGGSCVDFLNIILVLFQVKPNRHIISNGFETYYSPD